MSRGKNKTCNGQSEFVLEEKIFHVKIMMRTLTCSANEWAITLSMKHCSLPLVQ